MKLIPVAFVSLSPLCVRVNSSVTVPPGVTGSPTNAFDKVGAARTWRVSVAALPVRVAPSTVAVIGLVVLR